MPAKHEHLESRSKKSQSSPSQENSPFRLRLVRVVLLLLFGCITARLFYWQVLHRSVLQAQAENQYTRTLALTAQRGKIFTSDGYLVVGNAPMYRLFAQPQEMTSDPVLVAKTLAPLLWEKEEVASIAAQPDSVTATASTPVKTSVELEAEKQQELALLEASILKKISSKDLKWVALKQRVTEPVKQQIEGLAIYGLGFERYYVRDYPEASMAAQVLGFVGKDKEGNDTGYFGIEGALDRELRGYAEKKTFLKDALGFHLLFGNDSAADQFDGRDIVLTFRRDIQHAVEEILKTGIERYQASAGEVIVMEPQTGRILAMAAYPNYDPQKFYLFPPETYKNPTIASAYEPGSTFKVLTVAAGIDAGVITPETICDACDTARTIGSYTIKTWNNEYHPSITITDALAKSDNVAMIFVAEKLGQEKFIEYVKKFGIGDETGIELQEDTTTLFRKDWKPIDLATSSFGQGIATTGLQMVRAVAVIANKGTMVKPTIVGKVSDPVKGTEVTLEPIIEREVISPKTAEQVTTMMVNAAASGEAKWTSSRTHAIAGKTGTAQIPIDGHYDEHKTIASFIGFAPPENPKFVMLVKLYEPKTSPWASETAAPLWYKIAERLYLLLNIPPDK